MSEQEKPVITVRGIKYFVGDWVKPSVQSAVWMRSMYSRGARYQISGVNTYYIRNNIKHTDIKCDIYNHPERFLMGWGVRVGTTLTKPQFRYCFDGKLNDKEILAILGSL